MKSKKIKFLAYYLPQYHPIPENDEWWGKGFTEWTNVTKAKSLFRGHKQPNLPADLGFYDLRVPQVQIEQALLAKKNGIDGFIYYQYWFGNGKMLLGLPAERMLQNKDIDIPFCFCWANETWKGIWHGIDDPKVLIEQKYEGEEGYIRYFDYLLPFFKDDRYLKVDNKPMFHILRIEDIPNLQLFIKIFNSLAVQAGFDGIYFISTLVYNQELIIKDPNIYGHVGLDIFNKMRYGQTTIFNNNSLLQKIELKLKKLVGHTNKVGDRKRPLIFDYQKGVQNLEIKFPHEKYITCVFPNWDNSPRSGEKSMIFKNSTPAAWEKHLKKSISELRSNPENPPFVIIKSWNEWAEGNYLEPDQKYGLEWLAVVRKVKQHQLLNIQE
ncbi:hypothetical protein GCM10007103_32670 [Salinimicrobium marinum]|uniref:Glycosyltransferase WbsX n=1 Tax=Salinimicrobium marinum TaxID=680283 RepID=A0A918SKA8_9FLAO|nr:glycoside hydrolase family 99-like domain-containing protein [Salinimicrobium marinum]GHA49322.1 hypothetical protein GCM10007103_32670 [Salinimicrobium marinum]